MKSFSFMPVLVVGLLLLTSVAWADKLDEGLAAYQARDYHKAWTILSPLAEEGELEAQRKLGVMYRHGLGVQQDDKQAMLWYRRAAEGGHLHAQNSLGVMYRFGIGVDKDFEEGYAWIKKSANGGLAKAQENLGLLLYSGEPGKLSPDYRGAAIWLGIAASQGMRRSQATLGMMYLAGHGVTKDESKAMDYMRQAAHNGYFPAIEVMIAAHKQGLYGLQKSDEMVDYWQRVARNNRHNK